MKLKRWILCLIIFYSVANISISDSKAFTDLDETHWAYETIMNMNEKKIISGYNDGTFKPDKVMNKGEFATIISKAFELDKYGQVFEIWGYDLSDHWAEKYMNNVSPFIDDDNPNENITRKEALETIVKLKGLENQEIDYSIAQQFSDVNKYDSLIAIGIKNKFMSGKSEGVFAPSEILTRAEVAALINNILKAESKLAEDNTAYKLEINTINGYVEENVQYYTQGEIVTIEAKPKLGYYYIQFEFYNGPLSSCEYMPINQNMSINDGVKINFVMPANDVKVKVDFTREAGVVNTYPKNEAENIGKNFYIDIEFIKPNSYIQNSPEVASGFEVTDETGKVLVPVKEETLGNILRKTYENAKYKVANVRVYNNAWYLNELDGKDYNFKIYYGKKSEGNYKVELLTDDIPFNKKECYFENEEVEIVCDTRGYDNVVLKSIKGIDVSKITTKQEKNKYIVNFIMPQNDVKLELHASLSPIIVLDQDEWADGMVVHRIDEGETLQINAQVLPLALDDKTLVYSSANENIASVSNIGEITGISGGNTKIKIKNIANNLERDYFVHIMEKNKIQHFYYIPADEEVYHEGDAIPDLKLNVGEVFELVLWIDGSDVDYTATCVVDKQGIIDISDNGILKASAPYDVAGTIKAIAPGEAHITMTAVDGKKIEFNVIVE